MITHQGVQEPQSGRGIRNWLTDWLTRYMSEPVSHYDLRGRNDFDQLKSTIRKGDVLLVDGDQRVSSVIKYLTRSSWSHAVLYIGDELLRRDGDLKRRATTPTKGAVYFTCLGRGPHMFGAQSAELAAIQDELGEVPLVGFFCNGEISHNRVYSYTGVLSLFL